MEQNVSICKMVTVYTQYRRHFKGPRWDDFAISEYNRKKDYRIGRRSVEHRHQPLEWDSYESENTSDVDEYETRRDASREAKIPSEVRTRDKTGKNVVAKPVKQAWEAEGNTHERFNKEIATQTTHRTHSKRRRSKKKKSGRCKTEDEGKGFENARGRANERVPFVSYGWANDAPVGRKYTHNVRAHPEGVYPASLRALKRRELDIARRSEENKKKVQLEREIIKEKFFDLSHISPMFMTEYQRSYCNVGGEKTGYVW